MVSDIDDIDLGSLSSQPLLSMNANGEPDPDIYSECKTWECHVLIRLWFNPITRRAEGQHAQVLMF